MIIVDSKAYLSKTVTVQVDRPMCSRHPSQDFLYPINYGYIKGTISGDGHELDAYILGVFEPIATFTGQCIAVIHRTDDDDDKLVIVPDGVTYTDDQIRALTEFQERWFTSIILRQ
ncbi:MAG: inorganic diphosphatase [Caldilineaceae bacterium]